jgi:hypothetical protein
MARRLLCLIVIRVFGWLALLGRGSGVSRPEQRTVGQERRGGPPCRPR